MRYLDFIMLILSGQRNVQSEITKEILLIRCDCFHYLLILFIQVNHRNMKKTVAALNGF